MSDKRYTDDHEWADMDSEDTAIVGITDYAQEQLGDVVYVELPEIGDEFEHGADMAVVESVKAAAEVKAPVSGTIVEVNEELPDNPELVNESPLGDGWFCKIQLSNISEFDELMDEAQYTALVEQLTDD